MATRLLFISKKFLLISAPLLTLLSLLALFLFLRLQDEKAAAQPGAASSSRLATFPKLFLWAWERPEHLDFINPREVGVAFLHTTIYLRGEAIIKRPRLQPLKVPEGTTLMAVVRIEVVREATPSLSSAQRAEIIAALMEAARAPNVSALQIDFDALSSEREFYRELLRDLRPRLPEAMPLSITALASWCIHDNWLDRLPVDEAVPMLFRMGADERHIKSYLKAGGEFRSPPCSLSRGISTDEPLRSVSTPPRTYVFHTQAWTAASVRRAIERSQE
jgi:hypothetical protein